MDGIFAEDERMNCERAVELLTGPVEDSTASERRLAGEHVQACSDCHDAVYAVHALRLASLAPAPRVRPEAFERAISASAAIIPAVRPAATPFWLGMGLGAALAASLAVAIVSYMPGRGGEPATATPRLEMAVNEERDLSISLTTPEALVGAEIRVTLSGEVGLRGFPGQRELSWRADLDAGVNQLTLPVVATGNEGGQVLVAVVHDGKRRTFLVDVTSRA